MFINKREFNNSYIQQIYINIILTSLCLCHRLGDVSKIMPHIKYSYDKYFCDPLVMVLSFACWFL